MTTQIAMPLGHAAAAVPALERLAARDLPVKAAYLLAKLLAAVQAETAVYDAERAKLVRKYGDERDAASDAERAQFGPKVITVRPDDVDVFAAELASLNVIPITIPIAPFDLAALNGDGIAARDVVILGPLVTYTEG